MQPLSRLLRPRSIAVVGGGTWCAAVVEGCRRVGYAGPVWPVHPTKTELAGVAAFPSVEALPEAPDAAFIGVNRQTSVDVLGALSAMGAGGAVCFASGFRESASETGDGPALEAALVAAAGDMRILGPNCYGFVNLLDGAALWPDQHGGERIERGVAIVTQSSNLALNLTMQARGLPLAYVVTVGNQAQTGLSEIAEGLLEDARVTALGLHVEGGGRPCRLHRHGQPGPRAGQAPWSFSNPARRTARARRPCPIPDRLRAAMQGRARCSSGWAWRGVKSPAEMLEALKLLHTIGPLPSGRIGVLSSSGGEAGIISDMVADRRLQCPSLTAEQRAGLRAALGPKVALANPLDYHTYIWGDRAALAQVFHRDAGAAYRHRCRDHRLSAARPLRPERVGDRDRRLRGCDGGHGHSHGDPVEPDRDHAGGQRAGDAGARRRASLGGSRRGLPRWRPPRGWRGRTRRRSLWFPAPNRSRPAC